MSVLVKKETGSLVTLSNDLVRATYQLTVNELRLLLLAFAKMPKGNNTDEQLQDAYFITKDDIRRFNIDPKNIKRDMKVACDNLHKRTIEIHGVAGRNTVLKTYWVHNIVWYDDHPHYLARVVIHPDIVPFVCFLTTAYLQLRLADFANFKSFYSFRVYIMLMQWRNSRDKRVIITLDDFKRALKIEDKYPKMTDLKANVLDKAVEEINAHTPFRVQYTMTGAGGKSGRGVKLTTLHFSFEELPQADNEQDEFALIDKWLQQSLTGEPIQPDIVTLLSALQLPPTPPVC